MLALGDLLVRMLPHSVSGHLGSTLLSWVGEMKAPPNQDGTKKAAR